jgi:hypothetical protein
LENDLSIKSIDSEKESNTGDILKDIEEFVNNLEIEHKKEVVDYLTEAYNILLK